MRLKLLQENVITYIVHRHAQWVEIHVLAKKIDLQKVSQPGLEFHLWKGRATFILQRALPLGNLKVNGKLLKGHQGYDMGQRRQCMAFVGLCVIPGQQSPLRVCLICQDLLLDLRHPATRSIIRRFWMTWGSIKEKCLFWLTVRMEKIDIYFFKWAQVNLLPFKFLKLFY